MKYALVTGGSRGIGRAIAIKLAQEGYQVIINYASNQAEAEKTLASLNGQGELMPFDVSDSQQVRQAQFATFQKVLNAVINGQPVPKGDDMTITSKNRLQTITITPTGKKRQMFSSFILVVDSKTSALRQLRMNERAGNYVNYDFK